MNFDLEEAQAVLRRTPRILDAWLRGLPAAWIHANEGPATWSAFDIVGHLIHGERTDWIPRTRILLAQGTAQPFAPFDRFAQYEASQGQTLDDLLDTFTRLRQANLEALAALALTSTDLDRRGRHPDFGEVTLRELLSAWVVHDLNHLAQVARVQAKRYRADAGPWPAYLAILNW